MATAVAALVMITGVAQAGHRPDETLHVCETPGGALQVGEECRRGGTAHALVTEGGLGTVQGRLEALESENTALTGTVDALQSDLATAEGDVAQLQEAVTEVQEDLAEAVADNCSVTNNGNGTGVVTCGADSVTIRTPRVVRVDTGTLYASVAIGPDGNPVVSYQEIGQRDLKVAACTDPACGGAKVTTLDSGGNTGWYPSIAIDANGNPVISFYEDMDGTTRGALKVAACTDPACTSADVSTVDRVSLSRGYSSIAVGADGNPVVAYYDDVREDLKVAACSDPACATADLTTLDDNDGLEPSVAIGADDNPVISYRSNGLKVAACTDAACTTADLTTLDDNGGRHSSVAIGADDNPVISYRSNGLKVAACTDPACSSATLTEVDGTVEHADTSIAIGADGNPIVSYKDEDRLKVAACTSLTCTGFVDQFTVDSAEPTGYSSSIVIGTDGNPVIAYRAGTGFNPEHRLKVARVFN